MTSLQVEMKVKVKVVTEHLTKGGIDLVKDSESPL